MKGVITFIMMFIFVSASAIDVNRLSNKAKKEYSSILQEFKKKNPTKDPKDYTQYFQNILKAVEIKNKATGDLKELEKGKEAIQKAVSQDGIAHSPAGKEGNVYRYFRDKIYFLKKVNNQKLLQLVLKGEQEFSQNIKKGKDGFFYTFLKNLTGSKIRVFTTKNLKKFSSNFYKQLSNLLLTKKSNLVFSEEFYEIVIKERRVTEKKRKVAEKKRKVAEKKRKVAEKKRKVAEKERKVAEMKKNNDAGERILKKLGY